MSVGASGMVVFMCMAHCLASRSRPRAFARSLHGRLDQTDGEECGVSN